MTKAAGPAKPNSMGWAPTSRRSRVQGFEAHARAPKLTPLPNSPYTFAQAFCIVPVHLVATFSLSLS
jgi:hypothetical protein